MSKIIPFDDALYDYLLATNPTETDVQRRLREHTARMTEAELQISPEQTGLIQFLVKLSRAKKAIEIGVFTGYSSLAIALTMPEDGKLIACDVSEEWTSIGRKFWKDAGVDHKIELKVAPALQTTQALIDAGEEETFDFAFIDADKEGYPAYYDNCMKLVKSGGVLVFDNSLKQGNILNVAESDLAGRGTDEVNRRAQADPRVTMCHVNVADGMLLVMKN